MAELIFFTSREEFSDWLEEQGAARKIGSVWSAVNVKKVEALTQMGKMKPAGLELFNNRTDAQGYSSEHRNVPLAREYEEQIRENQSAWTFFPI